MADPRQLSYWDDEAALLWDALDELLIVAIMEGVEGGIDLLPPALRVLVDFDYVNDHVINFARAYRFDWIRKINDTTRTQIGQLISDWLQSGDPLSVLESQMSPIFGKVRAEMIASTEVTRVYAVANQIAWESTGVVESVRWNTAEDELVCPVCGPLADSTIGIGDIDAFPPAHPRCRCWITPIVSEQSLERRFEEIFEP
jgi:SPP1 gp7 family putative phage head morphogenesis protein